MKVVFEEVNDWIQGPRTHMGRVLLNVTTVYKKVCFSVKVSMDSQAIKGKHKARKREIKRAASKRNSNIG